MTLGVVQWSAGWLDTRAVHAMLAPPGLEFVGVFIPTELDVATPGQGQGGRRNGAGRTPATNPGTTPPPQ